MRIYEKKSFVFLILWCLFLFFVARSTLLRHLDCNTIDLLFLQRGPRSADTNIIIVGFDEKTHKKLKKSIFFWHKEIGQVIEGLSRHGAKVIALDLLQSQSLDKTLRTMLSEYLDEKGVSIPKGVIRGFGQDHYITQAILRSKERGTKMVMAFELTGLHKTNNVQPFFQFSRAVSASNLGFVNIPMDIDGVVRRYVLYTIDSDNIISHSFALQIASRASEENHTIQGRTLTFGHQEFSSDHLIDFHGPRGSFKSISFIDISKAVENNAVDVLSQFKDAIVVIGSTFVDDTQFTPFAEIGAGALELVPGPEVQASVVDNLLSGTRLQELPFLQNRHYLAVCILLLTALFLACKTGLSAILAGTFATVCCFVTWYAFGRGYFVPTASTLLIIAGSFAGTTLHRLFVSERKRRFIRHLFGQYISEPVVNELMSHPEYYKLEGELREVTILFADLRNFTSFSEQNKPETVVSILNRYFEEMTEAITGNRGIVDKFIGDGIMAFFGAPVGTTSHVLDAAQAALDMRSGLEKLNQQLEKQDIHLRFGVGIHSGLAIVGNVGSQKKLEYTVIGDTVNTASRIESANKLLDTEILLSAVSYEKVYKHYLGTAMEEIELKGKKGKTQLFRLDGELVEPNEDDEK